jgi:hypothetical protein
VCRNGTYEANGGHPIPNMAVDFNGLARAAGYPRQHDFASLAGFEGKVAQLLRQDGPVFATLHVEKGELSPKFDYRKLDDPRRRQTFKAALHGA